MHGHEELNTLKFGMKVIRYAKSSFERQILESVEIQDNRHHHLLNSRSEFNRCALPRMMCKLGDKTFKKNELEIETDMAREEMQVSKIRDLIKERNRQRGLTNRIKQKPPAAKRRKIDDKNYEEGQEQPKSPQEQPRQEKRKTDQELETQPMKKRKIYHDIIYIY